MFRIGIGLPSKIFSSASGYDPDALAYFTAASITDITTKNAINTFVLGLKEAAIWNKFYSIYPIVGTLAQSSYNLVNPSNYQVTWVDTPSLSSNTISFNGTTQYGNSNFSPISISGFNMNDVSIGVWDATGFNSRTEVPIGTTQNVGADRIRAVWFNTNNNIFDVMSNNIITNRVVFNSQGVGHWHFQRLGTLSKVFKNATSVGSTNAAGDVSIIPTNKIFLGASSDGNPGDNTPALFSQKSYKLFYIGKALTDSEVATFYSYISDLNTALGR